MYTFSDVLIEPQYSEINSRKDVDLTSNFLKLPVFSANMKTITGPEMAKAMFKEGGFGILHRFNTIDQAIEDFTQLFNEKITAGVSIGVNENDANRAKRLYDIGARIFCIDIAHGHCLQMKNMINHLKFQFKDIVIIAGNAATENAVYDLAKWGANIIKIGIGPGAGCTTRKNTGVGVPQLYALQKARETIKNYALDVEIIADGGITCVGDISKALVYANYVMLGKFLSGTTETPGAVFKNKDGEYYKVYMGSASGENKILNNQEIGYIEGIAMEVPFKGHVKYILKEIKEGLQSAFSYVGAKNLKEFQEKAKFIEISNGSQNESKF